MQFGQGGQFCFPKWVRSFLLASALVYLPSSTVSIAQENTGSLVDRSMAQLLYTIRVVEVPTEKAKPLTEKWNLVGASSTIKYPSNTGSRPNSAVIPASFTNTATTSEIRLSEALNDAQIDALIGAGNVVSSPKMLGHSGEEVSVRIGRLVPFVAAFEPTKDENGHDTTTLKPRVETIHDGIGLDLTGDLGEDNENIRLQFKLLQSKFTGMDTFTFESEHGPLTVQQPSVSVNTIQTTCNAPANETIAISGGPIDRDVVVEQEVPLLGKIPYVGRLFKNTAKATESISTIILIRCQERGQEHSQEP